MKVVLDSSALAKRYVEEEGSDEIEELLSKVSELGLCVICLPEVLSALNRLRREGALTDSSYYLAKAQLLEDIQNATILDLTSQVIAKTAALLETNPLRAMDALHVACAIVWNVELFISSDRRQADAARNCGLDVRFIGL